MLRLFSERTCAFDVEWAPCPDTARRFLKLPATTPDVEAVEAIWAHYAQKQANTGSNNTGNNTGNNTARPFIKLALSKVVSIAAVLRERAAGGSIRLTLSAYGVDELDEGELIRRFLEHVAANQYQLWGFNSAGSDLPILRQRAIALGVPCPRFAARPAKPWLGMDYFDTRTSDAHMDIMQLLANFQRGAATPSLDEFCAACGVPGKLDVDGAQVADLFLQGNIRRIVEYNETDALTTHLIALRLALHAGKLSPPEFDAEIDAARQLLQEQIDLGKEQFVKFRDAWEGQ